MSDFKEWERSWTDEQLEEMLFGGAHPGSPAYEVAKYILDKRRGEREQQGAARRDPAGQASHPIDFSFITNAKLRSIAERDWDECQRAFQSKCWKSVLILAGGLVETVLLSILARRKKRTLGTKAAAGAPTDLTRWELNRLVKAAVELKLMPPAVEALPEPLRKYRNLAHPGNEVREKLEFGEPDAATAFHASRAILARTSGSVSEGVSSTVDVSTTSPIEDKWIDTEYLRRIGVVEKLKADGYQVQLDSANNESRMVDLDGWERVVVEQDDKRFVLKIHDHPAVGGYMILLRKRI